MTTRQKILIISFSDLRYDGRVTRQINFLKKEYDVDVLALENNDYEGFDFIKLDQVKLTVPRKIVLSILLLLRNFNLAYWIQYPYKKQCEHLSSRKYDLIIANDVETLPFAFNLDKDSVFFDAHEYAPRHYEERLWWRVFFKRFNHFLCAKYLQKTKGMITVCDGLAKEYLKDYGVNATVVTNAPHFKNVDIPEKTKGVIRIIHHGIANASRKMENMLHIMDELGEGYSLDLMLMIPEYASKSSKKYVEDFVKEVELRDNVKMIPSVKSTKIVDVIKDYDIGLFLLEPINFNYTHALPNKLFEFIQARLAVAIGPSQEMMKIVNHFNCGVVSSTFDSKELANKIKNITADDLMKFKRNSAQAANELNAEVNKKILLKLIKSVI